MRFGGHCLEIAVERLIADHSVKALKGKEHRVEERGVRSDQKSGQSAGQRGWPACGAAAPLWVGAACGAGFWSTASFASSESTN